MSQANQLKKLFLRKRKTFANNRPCMFVDENGNGCKARAIASHTIQKSGALKKIAESGNLYKIQSNLYAGSFKNFIDFKKIGRSKASIFPGFCKKHDHSVFAEIETQTTEISKRALLLLTYRVVCLEIFEKEINAQLYTDKAIVEAINKSPNPNDLQDFVKDTNEGLRDLKRMKAEYEAAIHHSTNLDSFTGIVFTLEESLPFSFAAPIIPEYGFDGKRLQPRSEESWDGVGIYAGQLGKVNAFTIAGFSDDKRTYIKEFIGSFQKVPSSEIGDVALNVAIDFIENTFYKISWVDTLTFLKRGELLNRFSQGYPNVLDNNRPKLFVSQNIVNMSCQAIDLY